MSDVTLILQSIDQGDVQAADRLLPLVYNEMRKLAAAKLSQEKPGQTLNATALVHEAYLRLVGGTRSENWQGRRHFFGAAAEAMRRILIDNARRKQRVKHGGARQQVPMEDFCSATPSDPSDLLELDQALERLAAVAPDKAELVRLRYFAGLTLDQAADALGISRATASRHWTYARCWLYASLTDNPPPATG